MKKILNRIKANQEQSKQLQEDLDNTSKATKTVSPFDIIKSINNKSQFNRDKIETDYNSFIINKNYSLTMDTLYYAEFMNIQPSVINQKTWNLMSYDFLYHLIPKQNRYTKWDKKDAKKDEIIKMIQQVYDYSYNKALEVYPLLKDSEKQLKKLLEEPKGRLK